MAKVTQKKVTKKKTTKTESISNKIEPLDDNIKIKSKQEDFFKKYKYRKIRFENGSTIETDTENMIKITAQQLSDEKKITNVLDLYEKQNIAKKTIVDSTEVQKEEAVTKNESEE